MAVIVHFEWPGLTEEQFNEARRVIGWEDNPAKGSIVQAQGWDNGVFKASDLWESEADWNNFLQTRVQPGMAQLNYPGQPSVRVFPAYRVFSPGLRQPTNV